MAPRHSFVLSDGIEHGQEILGVVSQHQANSHP